MFYKSVTCNDTIIGDIVKEGLEDLIAGWLLNGDNACTCKSYEQVLKVADDMATQMLRIYNIEKKEGK